MTTQFLKDTLKLLLPNTILIVVIIITTYYIMNALNMFGPNKMDHELNINI